MERKAAPSRSLTLVMAVLLGMAGNRAWAIPAEAIAERWGPSILSIRIENGEGSGFFIGDSQAITNWHVVQGAEDIVATGKDGVARKARVVASLPEHDLALLEFEEPAGKGKAMEVRESPARDLETVYVCGNPNSLRFVWSDGKVGNASQKMGQGECIQITAPISPGSSGGPLLDAEGKVIGVVVGYLPEGQNLNFAIPARYIRQLMEKKSHESPSVDPAGIRLLERLGRQLESQTDETIASEIARLRSLFQEEAYWLVEIGVVLFQKGKEERAIELFEAALSKNPAMARAWANLGAAQYKSGNKQKAIQAYRKALELAPDDESITIQAARAYERLGQGDQAREILQGAQRRHPDWEQVRQGLKKLQKES